MKLFSEKVQHTFTNSSFNILQVENFSEIFFDVYEIELNKSKYPVEKVGDHEGHPVVSVPVVIGENECNYPFVLMKGTFEVLFNADNVISEQTENLPISNSVVLDENVEEFEELPKFDAAYHYDNSVREDAKKKLLEQIQNAKTKAANDINRLKKEAVRSAFDDIKLKKEEFDEILANSKKLLVEEFITISNGIKAELLNANHTKYSEVKDTVSAKIGLLAEKLQSDITNDFSTATENFDKRLKELVMEMHSSSVMPALKSELANIATDIVGKVASIEDSLDSKLSTKADISLLEGVANEISVIQQATVELNNNINKGVNKALSRVGNVNNRIDEVVGVLSESVDDKLKAVAESITEYYSNKLKDLEDQTIEINENSRKYFIDLIQESRDNLTTEIRNIKKDQPIEYVIESKGSGKRVSKSFDTITSELDKKISDKISDEVIRLRKYIAVYSGGGGTVAQQFANGGTMNGNLTVNGTLSVNQLYALSANFTVIDIKQYELSGFNVKGDVVIEGNVTSTGTLSTNNIIFNSSVGNTLSAINVYGSNLVYNSTLTALSGNWQTAYQSLSTKANLVGGNAFTGDQTVAGNIAATGNAIDNGGSSFGNSISMANTNAGGSANLSITTPTKYAALALYGASYGGALANQAVFNTSTSLTFLTNGNLVNGGTDVIKFTTGGYTNSPTMTIGAGNPGLVTIAGNLTVGAALTATTITANNIVYTSTLSALSGNWQTAYQALSTKANLAGGNTFSGTQSISSSSTGGVVFLSAYDGNRAGMGMITDSSGRAAVIITGRLGGGNGGAYLNLEGQEETWTTLTTRSNTSGRQVMRFGNLSDRFSIQLLNNTATTVTSTPFSFANQAPSNSFYMGGTGGISFGSTYDPGATNLFTTGTISANNLVFTTGNQAISGTKTFDMVGIGTNSPSQLLHVNGDGARVRISSTNLFNNPVLELGGVNFTNYLFAGSDGAWQIRTDSATRPVYIQSIGNQSGSIQQGTVQIGGISAVSAPTSQLVVRSNFNNLTGNLLELQGFVGNQVARITNTGDLSTSGTVTATNLVYNTTDQTIAGNKTFTNNIVGNGIANTLPNQTAAAVDHTLIATQDMVTPFPTFGGPAPYYRIFEDFPGNVTTGGVGTHGWTQSGSGSSNFSMAQFATSSPIPVMGVAVIGSGAVASGYRSLYLVTGGACAVGNAIHALFAVPTANNLQIDIGFSGGGTSDTVFYNSLSGGWYTNKTYLSPTAVLLTTSALSAGDFLSGVRYKLSMDRPSATTTRVHLAWSPYDTSNWTTFYNSTQTHAAYTGGWNQVYPLLQVVNLSAVDRTLMIDYVGVEKLIQR